MLSSSFNQYSAQHPSKATGCFPDSGERRMNPIVMTIINPRKEYCPSRGSNQRPQDLKSCTLPAELRGLGDDGDDAAEDDS